MRQRTANGFTLVELVIAIVLLGIVSVTVSSRWFSADAFHADTLKAQMLAEARLAQRTALSNSQIDISLVVTQVGDEWRYQLYEDSGSGRSLVRETAADTGDVGISVTSGITQSLGPGVDLDVTYDGLGNLAGLLLGGVARDASSGVQMELAGAQLCLSPLGYAHDGPCV